MKKLLTLGLLLNTLLLGPKVMAQQIAPIHGVNQQGCHYTIWHYPNTTQESTGVVWGYALLTNLAKEAYPGTLLIDYTKPKGPVPNGRQYSFSSTNKGIKISAGSHTLIIGGGMPYYPVRLNNFTVNPGDSIVIQAYLMPRKEQVYFELPKAQEP